MANFDQRGNTAGAYTVDKLEKALIDFKSKGNAEGARTEAQIIADTAINSIATHAARSTMTDGNGHQDPRADAERLTTLRLVGGNPDAAKAAMGQLAKDPHAFESGPLEGANALEARQVIRDDLLTLGQKPPGGNNVMLDADTIAAQAAAATIAYPAGQEKMGMIANLRALEGIAHDPAAAGPAIKLLGDKSEEFLKSHGLEGADPARAIEIIRQDLSTFQHAAGIEAPVVPERPVMLKGQISKTVAFAK